MKRAPVMLSGAIVSCLVGAAMQPATADEAQATTVRAQLPAQPAQSDTRKQAHTRTDAPRGDLRGDIAKNVRGHPNARRNGPNEPLQAKTKPGSR